MTNSRNLNNKRRQRNIISIAFNLGAWSLDLIGDMLGQVIIKQNYILFMSLALGFAAGVSPLVYMIGAGNFFWESKQNQEVRRKEVWNEAAVAKNKRKKEDKAKVSTGSSSTTVESLIIPLN